MPTIKTREKVKKQSKKVHKKYLLRLYVVGQTPNCQEAYINLKKTCDEFIPNTYTIELIDLLKFPHLAKSDRIIAIPTVIRKLPVPVRKIIGNLSDMEKVLVGLDIRPDK